MDIYCPRCGEPWDSCLWDLSPEEISSLKNGLGCPDCKGKRVESRPFRAQLSAVILDILGDDVDGVASCLEDAEDLGII